MLTDKQKADLQSLNRADKLSPEDKQRLWQLQRLSHRTRPAERVERAPYQGPTVAETMARIDRNFGRK